MTFIKYTYLKIKSMAYLGTHIVTVTITIKIKGRGQF